MPIMLSTNERELYLTDPLFHRLVDNLVALAIEHQAYRAEDGRRLSEAVNAARAILEERQQLLDRTDGYLARRPNRDQAMAVMALRQLGEAAALHLPDCGCPQIGRIDCGEGMQQCTTCGRFHGPAQASTESEGKG